MSSNLLKKIGLGNVDIGVIILILTVLVIITITLLIVFIVQNVKLKNKYKKFMQGSKAKSLEKEIHDLISNVHDLSITSQEHTDDINEIYRKHESAYQKMGLVKYDAFKEMGGKLSFGLALLDEKDNGFIINSVHSSTGCYSYTKRIKEGKCELDLSEEEKVALDKAIKDIK